MRRIRKYWKVLRSIEKKVEMGGGGEFVGRERVVINYVSNVMLQIMFLIVWF